MFGGRNGKKLEVEKEEMSRKIYVWGGERIGQEGCLFQAGEDQSLSTEEKELIGLLLKERVKPLLLQTCNQHHVDFVHHYILSATSIANIVCTQ